MSHTDSAAWETRFGVLYALGAYVSWGMVPIYFKAVTRVPALELLAHRCVWSLLVTGWLMLVLRGWRPALAALRGPGVIPSLLCSTLLIAINWLTFIWAVANDRVLEASLGYYINPLVSILLGFVFLKERLRPRQAGSVLLAACGVAYLTFASGVLPWVALVLAISFGFYGLLRKTVRMGALPGLTLETLLLTPPALMYLLYLSSQGRGHFATGEMRLDVLLACAGPVTAVPLLLFAAAARRLRLATVGVLQFLAPSIHFLLAVVWYGEPLNAGHLVCFACIWSAVVLYCLDAARALRR